VASHRALPAELSSFVGRRRELAQGKELLARTRLLTVTGLGGVGKTRLALQLARSMAGSFPAGVSLVELANVRDPGLVAASVAATLRLEDRGQGSVRDLGEQLRAARMLVVLDNCEHVLAAAGQTVTALLESCPQLRLLVTSRAPLGVDGETVLALAPLAQPDRAERPDPDRLLGFDAVRLFAERAAAAVPGFVVSAENTAALTALCHRLDGLPLALELAAGRLRALELEQLLEQLECCLGVLRAVGPDRGRQQTLWATLDWSHELLGETERAAWRRLSVFAGGFTLLATEAVCTGGPVAPDEVVNLLAALVDHSLVVRVGSRYQMLEVVRQYAWDRLGRDDDRLAAVRRHREHFSRLATEAQARWWGPDQAQLVRALSVEHDNYVAAVERCRLDPDTVEAGLALLSDLWPLWVVRGHLTEGRRYLARLLDQSSEPTRARARALRVAGAMAVNQGDLELAAPWLTEAAVLARQFGDRPALAQLLGLLASVAGAAGDGDRMRDLFDEALALARQTGDGLTMVFVLHLRGALSAARGECAQAAGLFGEALRRCREAGDRWMRRSVLQGLGMCLTELGQLNEAAARFRESVEQAGDLQDWRGVAIAAEGLARVQLARGHPEDTALLLGAASSIWQVSVGGLPAAWFGWHERCERETRACLGKRRFDTAYRDGAALSVDDTLVQLLGRPAPTATERTGRAGSAVLTRREAEVARLVAQGLRNRQIAAHLFLSERTVESHVDHILTKLGLSSRTQVVAWAGDLGLHLPATAPRNDRSRSR
jgi:non-specific serine/threonine protein kinase